jgi:ATP-dependent RNA helicase DDX52/ROK1
MDLFHLLGGGARFDKKRFQHDIGLFEGEKEANQAQSKQKNAAVVDSSVRSQLLDEIDFFKNTHTIVETQQDKETVEDSKKSKKSKKKSSFIITFVKLTSF